METMISKALENLKRELNNFFSGEEKNLQEAEIELSRMIAVTTADLLSKYYEAIDRRIYEDKERRKNEELRVERKNDKREILTVIGTVKVRRTYYRRGGRKYVYPLDEVMGIESYQRVSGETSSALVNAAIYDSYARSSEMITNGIVSKQTVMNKIRQAYPHYNYPSEKKDVPILHIDADEDHVSLQNRRNVIVPLITVYEGVDRTGKRHKCLNAFHVGRYGVSSEKLWEEVYNEVTKRYDIENTVIYIHGDGAGWIKEGLEWFNDAIFVLDPYHKNKSLKQTTSNMTKEECDDYQSRLNECLRENKPDEFLEIQAEMCEAHPELAENILKNTGYLYSNIDAISIRTDDEEARNGGATEPHISHGLSARLSSRPRGWSAETLKRFVPILAAREASFEEPSNDYICKDNIKIPRKAGVKIKHGTIGLPDPDTAVSIASSISGKTSPCYTIFKALWG